MIQMYCVALDALVLFSDTWQLPIYINKCCLLNIGKKNPTALLSVLVVVLYLL